MNLKEHEKMNSMIKDVYRGRSRNFHDLLIESKNSGMSILKMVEQSQIEFLGEQVNDSIIYVTYSQKVYDYVSYRMNEFPMIKELYYISNEKWFMFYYIIGMIKLDCIIMNPPYSVNLHLKIIQECLKHIKDDGQIVNLSPIRWFQDIAAPYKKGSDFLVFNDLIKKCHYFDSIDQIEAGKLFSNGLTEDLGIYVFKNERTDYLQKIIDSNPALPIFNKVLSKIINGDCESLKDRLEKDKRDGWRWQTGNIQPITAQGGAKGSYGWYRRFCIHNHLRSTLYFNGKKDGTDWTRFNSGIKKEIGSPIPLSIKLSDDNEQMAINYEESLKTKFIMFLVSILKVDQNTPYGYIPFMGECINPRTGLKGYLSDWIDSDFYEFFGITEEEISLIETTLKDYE